MRPSVEKGALFFLSADEPLANLDTRLREEMRDELSALARAAQITVVAVTHDQAEAFALADDVVVLHEGRLAQQGPPRAVYQAPRTPFVGTFTGPLALGAGVVDDDGVSCADGRLRLPKAAVFGLPAAPPPTARTA